MRVLLVDDHSLMRSGIRDSLSKHYDNTSIFEAESGRAALALTRQQRFDLALIDLFIPGEKLFKLVGDCCADNPDLPVIVLSASENSGHVRKCIDLGAVGFVSKSLSQDCLFEAIDLVRAGGTYFPAPSEEPRRLGSGAADLLPLSLDYDAVRGILTKRQMEILGLMAQGQPNKKIAQDLGLSNDTVKVHVSAIFKSLGLSNRSQAAILGEKLGLFLQSSDR